MKKEDYYIKFKTHFIEFIDELIQQFDSEVNLILFRVYIKNKINDIDLMGKFMKNCLPFKDIVKNRDESFFDSYDITNNDNYKVEVGNNENNIKIFKNLWESDTLDDDDRETMWKWIESLIKLCDKYYKEYGYIKSYQFNLDLEMSKLN
jgi:hypothetical protein